MMATRLRTVAAQGHRAPPGRVGIAAVMQESAALWIRARAEPCGVALEDGGPAQQRTSSDRGSVRSRDMPVHASCREHRVQSDLLQPRCETRRLGLSTDHGREGVDRKSTRLNSSHVAISYAVFC